MRVLFEEYYRSLHRVLKREGKSKYSLIVSEDMGKRLFPSNSSNFDDFISGMREMITERLQMADTLEITRHSSNLNVKIRGCALCPLNVELCEGGIEPGCLLPGLLFTGLKKTFNNSFHISAENIYFEKNDVGDCDWVFRIKLDPRSKKDV